MRTPNENWAASWESTTALVADRDSAPPREMRSCDNLLQRFFSELGHSPCLTDAEEQQLTGQAHTSWQQLCALLTQGPQPGDQSLYQNWTVSCPEHLCEQDVVTILDRGKTFSPDPHYPATAAADFSSWLTRVHMALHTFRAARDELVQRNLRLVFTIARQYRNAPVAQLDLIQEGVFGLMRAIEKFDPTKGFKLSTYAAWWIRQAIFRALKRTSRSVRLSTTTVHTGIPDMATVPVTLVSFDTPITDTDSPSLAETLSHPDDTPEEVLLEGDQRKRLYRGLDNLAPQDATLLRLRFGLTDGHPRTLEEVGQHLQMSREQVRQREERALMCLRRLLQALDAGQRPTTRTTTKGAVR
ncbi:MAG: RNA polymerase sigma factor RpoD/SigA [Deltaproteobacteria bacterium]|nr:RNA polymerase sigma factor RpoD/SigA [Deltaproteobacteria bacterium]